MAKAQLVSREANIARMTVELDAKEVDRHYARAYREFAGELKLPGFRKGKVPPNVIRTRLGAETIDSAVADMLKDYAVGQALTELKLTPRQGAPQWHSDPDPAEGQPLAYELSLPVLPEVVLPDYATYQLDVPKLIVSDEMKERYRQRLADTYTEYPPKDGAAEQGDALSLSFATTFREGGKPTPLKHDELTYIIGKEGNLPGWDEQVLGLAAGTSKDFDYDVPENFADQRVAGKPVRVSLEVKQVHRVVAPSLDEQFIKEKLHMDSPAQFEDYVDNSLKRERDAQLEQLKRDKALERVVEEMTAEVTEDMVGDEIDGLVKDNDRTLHQYDSSLEEYLAEKGQTIQEYREALRGVALRKIKQFLIVQAVAEAQQLDATSDDFQRYATYLMQREGIPPDKLKELFAQSEFLAQTRYQIVREKVLAHIAASAEFTEEEHEVQGGS